MNNTQNRPRRGANNLSMIAAGAFALGLVFTAGNVWALDSTIDFIAPGPADWNTATNWDTPGFGSLVPGDGFPHEIVSISNSGIGTLDMPAMFPVFQVVLGETHNPSRPGGPNAVEEEGTLNISGDGSLPTVAMRVGDAGLGVLNMSGGRLTADSLRVGGDPDSTLNLSGDGIVKLDADAALERITRIEGPNVIFDVKGDLSVAGTFLPVITGGSHSAITSLGNVSLGGILRPEFDGHVPGIGESWTLVDAVTVVGQFASVDASAASLPPGAVFDVLYDTGGSGDVVLTIIPVPEPAALVLICLGTASMLLYRYRRPTANVDQ